MFYLYIPYDVLDTLLLRWVYSSHSASLMASSGVLQTLCGISQTFVYLVWIGSSCCGTPGRMV